MEPWERAATRGALAADPAGAQSPTSEGGSSEGEPASTVGSLLGPGQVGGPFLQPDVVDFRFELKSDSVLIAKSRRLCSGRSICVHDQLCTLMQVGVIAGEETWVCESSRSSSL